MVHPAVEAIVLAPIVPLTLTQRPVVFPDTEDLTLTLRGRRRQVHVTFDGQASHPLLPGDVLKVRKSDIRVQLLSLPETNYFRVLRKKLLWSALPPEAGAGDGPGAAEPDLTPARPPGASALRALRACGPRAGLKTGGPPPLSAGGG